MKPKYYAGDPDYYEDLALGKVPNKTIVNKFGFNDDVDTGDGQQLISYLGVYGMPEEAKPITVISDNAGDVLNGSGAWLFKLWLIDDEGYEQIIELGIGETTTELYKRCYKARVIKCGNPTPNAVGNNLGDITILQVGGEALVVIPPHEGSTLCACYTVSKGKTALVYQAFTTVGKNKDTVNRFKMRDYTDPEAPYTTEGLRGNFQNQVGRDLLLPSKVNEMHDIIFVATTENNNTTVSADFLMMLIENPE